MGILYDEVSLQTVLDMTSDWTAEEREMLRNKVIYPITVLSFLMHERLDKQNHSKTKRGNVSWTLHKAHICFSSSYNLQFFRICRLRTYTEY